MKKTLIIFAHPALQKSRVNRVLIEGLDEMEGITFHDLYEVYPELDIDVNLEKQLLAGHDTVIFQHPLFWYSTPAILKEWQDLVLEHGWAYGSQGTALQGKLFFNVLTSGGQKEAYTEKGYNNFTIRQLLSAIEQTANLCRMIYLPPFVLHGTHSITSPEIQKHKADFHRLLSLLKEGRINPEEARKFDYLNEYLEKTHF